MCAGVSLFVVVLVFVFLFLLVFVFVLVGAFFLAVLGILLLLLLLLLMLGLRPLLRPAAAAGQGFSPVAFGRGAPVVKGAPEIRWQFNSICLFAVAFLIEQKAPWPNG